MFSTERVRSLRPNILMTLQNEQSYGQPHFIMMGWVTIRSWPSSRSSAGKGRLSRSSPDAIGASGLSTCAPFSMNDRPMISCRPAGSRSPRNHSRNCPKPTWPSRRMT